MGELTALVTEKNYDVIAITEVFPKTQNLDYSDIENNWNLQGYTLHHPTKKSYTGRGCIIYTNNKLNAYIVGNEETELIEYIQIGIKIEHGTNILVSCIYRSPNSTSDRCVEELGKILSKKSYLNTKYDTIVHMGDFNYKEINWETTTTTASIDHQSSKFIEKIMDNFLYQHVNKPTRYRGEETPNILDLVFTNEAGMIDSIDHCSPLGNSDHEILEFNLMYSTPILTDMKKDKKMCYFKGDYDTINSELTQIEWENILATGGINDLWDRFVDSLSNSCRKNIPVYKSKPKCYDTPWMNKETLTAVQNKRKMWKKYKYCRNPQNKANYDQAKYISSQKVREAQIQYEESIAKKTKEDPKIFWKYVQSKTKVKDNIDCIIDKDGEIHTENGPKAKLLNIFFQSVFNIDTDTDELPHIDTKTEERLTTVVFNEEIVTKHLNLVNETKSQGADSIHPKLIKETVTSITIPVTKIFNKSMQTSQLPSDWKLANITPIHKKGPRHDVSNYRPISLTSIICKTMERIIRDCLMKHMEDNNLFTKHQHGFRKGKSCVTQLIEVMEKWTEELDEQNAIDCIYLDFQKAFDTVSHKRLIHKLKAYGITGNLLLWIEDFLNGRKQRVILNGDSSEWANVTSGIPQGSVLGPILFTIYINDLPDVVENFVKLFADDTKIYATVNTEQEKNSLQKDIDSLTTWSDTWLLKFNKSKCKHLHLGPSTDTNYTMNNETITTTDKEKDLGITIDQKLNFQEHINTQVKKANQKVGMINRTFKYLNKDMFLALYKSLIRPHLEYGSTVWSVINKREAILIENVQRRATRLLKNLQHYTYGERLLILGLPTLEYRRIRSDLVETYKILNGIDKVECENNIFPQRVSNTRGNQQKIFKKHCRTNKRKYSFSQRIVDNWNSLPDNVVGARSVNSFKSQLNKYWKDYPVKFVPSFYGPEANVRTNIEMDQRRNDA